MILMMMMMMNSNDDDDDSGGWYDIDSVFKMADDGDINIYIIMIMMM